MNSNTLIGRYEHAMNRWHHLTANNRPRAARRWLRRAGGLRAVLWAKGVTV